MRTTTDGDGDTDGSPIDETLSGIGIWTGLMPVADEMVDDEMDADQMDADQMDADEETEFDKRTLVAEIDRLFERYQWFVDHIDHPRRRTRCTRILNAPRQEPGAWLRALVELSLIGTPRAKVFLEKWEPPELTQHDMELELFRRICAAKCDG